MTANPSPPSLSRTQSSPNSFRPPPAPVGNRSNTAQSWNHATFPRQATRRPPLSRTAEDSVDDRPRQDDPPRRQPPFSQSGFEQQQKSRGPHEAYFDAKAEQKADAERRRLEAEAVYLQHMERLQREEQARRLAQEAWKRVEEERQRAEELRKQTEAARRAEEAARKLAEERRRADEARAAAERHAEAIAREQLKRQQQRARTKDPLEAWNEYERRWLTFGQDDSENVKLTFDSFPWPMNPQPASVQELDAERIKSFILSPTHSQNKSHKQILREQLLRFHPDRFEGRWLSRVRESDRAAVKEGVNIIVRYLNDALALYNSL